MTQRLILKIALWLAKKLFSYLTNREEKANVPLPTGIGLKNATLREKQAFLEQILEEQARTACSDMDLRAKVKIIVESYDVP